MKLSDYLKSNGLTYEAFGARGAWSDETVRQWCVGGRMPRPRAMERIRELTGGHVQPGDFYEPLPPSATNPAPEAAA